MHARIVSTDLYVESMKQLDMPLDGAHQGVQLMKIASRPHYVHARSSENDAQLAQSTKLRREQNAQQH